MNKYYWVYILTNRTNVVLYVGITNNLKRRVYEHQKKLVIGFTSKYNLTKLIYYCQFNDVRDAISYEKKIKGWIRIKKNALVSNFNPTWGDLSHGL